MNYSFHGFFVPEGLRIKSSRIPRIVMGGATLVLLLLLLLLLLILQGSFQRLPTAVILRGVGSHTSPPKTARRCLFARTRVWGRVGSTFAL